MFGLSPPQNEAAFNLFDNAFSDDTLNIDAAGKMSGMRINGKPFQKFFPGNGCAGCGPANKTAHGHRIKTRWISKPALETICEWKPRKSCKAGVGNVLHGGCAISLMDCNSIWTAIAARYDLEKRDFASEPFIFYVTAAINARLIKPIPIDMDHLTVISKVMELKTESRKCVLFSEIVLRGEKCAEADIVAVRIEPPDEELKKLLAEK